MYFGLIGTPAGLIIPPRGQTPEPTPYPPTSPLLGHPLPPRWQTPHTRHSLPTPKPHATLDPPPLRFLAFCPYPRVRVYLSYLCTKLWRASCYILRTTRARTA